MPFITINNRTLHYLDVGEGPALLMGHTYLANHSVWREQINVLSQHYRCIVPDLWGHGLSSPTPGEKVSVRSLSEDYWVLMQALDIARYSVIGQAVGGMWGIQMALDYPSSINALVLISPSALEYTQENRQFYSELFSFTERQQTVPRRVVEQLVPLFFSLASQQEKPELAMEFEDSLFNMKGDNLSTVVDMGRNILEKSEGLVGLDRLAVPTLILAGEHAKRCSSKQSQLLSENIQGADLQLIPRAGHLSSLEQPEAVNLHLSAFLGRVHQEGLITS